MSEYPNIHRVGCYAYFMFLAFAGGVLVGVLFKAIGFEGWLANQAVGLVILTNFLALRDMTRRPRAAAPTSHKGGQR